MRKTSTNKNKENKKAKQVETKGEKRKNCKEYSRRGEDIKLASSPTQPTPFPPLCMLMEEK